MKISNDVAQRAVQWMLELQSPSVSPTTLEQWRQWRYLNAEHECAWQRIESFNERFAALHSAQNTLMAHATLANEQSRRQAIKTLVLMAAAGTALWAARDTRLVQDWRADYYSVVGERRTVHLTDGTQVQLNTDSAIDVHFTPTARKINLLRGEIMVSTGKDAQARPFWLQAGQGRIQALGTGFSVRQERGYCRVAVWQDSVALSPVASTQPPTVLHAGQQALLTRDSLGPVHDANDESRAWTDGIIIASNQRLADFIQEIKRYRPGHLGLVKSLADVRVSGTFPLADTDRILETLAATLNLQVRYHTRWWVNLAPRQNNA